MTKTITLLVGPPGSGKSLHAHSYWQAHNNRSDLIYVNQDSQGKKGHLDIFNEAIANGHDIIVDRMNHTLGQRNRYLDPARKRGYETRIIVLHVPFDTCLERCKKRQNHETIKDAETAEKAIRTFFRFYERVNNSEVDQVIRNGWGVGADDRDKVIICDLDGTLCDIEHRRKYLETSDKHRHPNWKAFFENMDNDTVNPWCAELLDIMRPKYPIVYATGRPEDYREITLQWLKRNGVDFHKHLFTRPKSDMRKDSIIKEIILEFELKTRYDILMIIDDRTQVVEMWRDHGYTVLQCDEGNF